MKEKKGAGLTGVLGELDQANLQKAKDHRHNAMHFFQTRFSRIHFFLNAQKITSVISWRK